MMVGRPPPFAAPAPPPAPNIPPSGAGATPASCRSSPSVSAVGNSMAAKAGLSHATTASASSMHLREKLAPSPPKPRATDASSACTRGSAALYCCRTPPGLEVGDGAGNMVGVGQASLESLCWRSIARVGEGGGELFCFVLGQIKAEKSSPESPSLERGAMMEGKLRAQPVVEVGGAYERQQQLHPQALAARRRARPPRLIGLRLLQGRQDGRGRLLRLLAAGARQRQHRPVWRRGSGRRDDDDDTSPTWPQRPGAGPRSPAAAAATRAGTRRGPAPGAGTPR